VHFEGGGKKIIDKAVKCGEIELDPSKLGAWDLEGYFDKGRFLRAKCYMEEDKEGLHATVAGLPADPGTGQFSKKRSCLNWDNFNLGTVISEDKSNKLRT